MKTLLTTLAFCLLYYAGTAQKTFPVLDTDGNAINYNVSSLNSRTPLVLQADKFTTSIKPFQEIPNDHLGTIVYLEKANKVLLTTLVRKDSLKYYRYSVIENDSITLVDNGMLTKVNFVWNERSSYPGYLTMDLDIPNITGKKITVKIHRLPDPSRVTTLIIYNKPFTPAKLLAVNIVSKSKEGKTSSITLKNNMSVHLDSDMKQLYVSMKKTDLDFVYQLHIMSTSTDKSHLTFGTVANRWRYDSADGHPYCLIDISQLKDPGEYKITVVPQAGPDIEMSKIYSMWPNITFNVLSVPRVFLIKDVLKIVAIITLIALTIAGVTLYIIRKRNHKKLQIAHNKSETARGELDQIRSQLNPHFVYNSLSGIQNLMNQNETERANAYLSKFARLTRNILNDQTLISIRDERNLLDDYLSMESLRFQFSYEINIIGDTNFPNTEIPAMLLQPFVENSVKYSMATLQNKGKLLIEITADQKNIILSVKDNGKGFDTSKTYEGLGLKLCKKRIELLNQVYKECPISMNIDSGITGTTVTIILENWL